MIYKIFNYLIFFLLINSFSNEIDNPSINPFDSITSKIDSLYNIFDSIYRLSFTLEDNYEVKSFSGINPKVIKLKKEALYFKSQADSLIMKNRILHSNFIYTKKSIRDSLNYLKVRTSDSIIEAEKLEKIRNEEIEKTRAIKKEKVFYLDNISITDCNSAGGISIQIECTLFSKKTIKYMYFTVKAYNRVNDVEYCQISNKSTSKLRVIGPINPDPNIGTELTYNWENIWYNYAIENVKLTSWEVVYLDGTTIKIK